MCALRAEMNDKFSALRAEMNDKVSPFTLP
jgi:hypothetical protein